MSAQEIIDAILKHTGFNAKSFSERIGLERAQAIYDIQKGKTKNISPQMANKILSVFSEFSKSWLLSGEGPMLKEEPGTLFPAEEPTVEATAISQRFIEIVDYIKDNVRDQDNAKQSYATIAENIGVPVSLINKVKEGKANVTFSPIKRLCSVYQVSRDWLEDGVGRPLPESADQDGVPMLTNVDTDSLKPHFEASAAFCGMPGGFAIAIEEYKCKKYSIPNLKGHDFTLIASGRSMINRNIPEKSIFNNDVVACKLWKSRSYLRWGEVYALATPDGIIIKKVMQSDLGTQYIQCVSFNVEEGYMPFDLPVEEIQDWAIVIGVAHINKWN
ncbi:LexA family transcriptional regulator [Parabacteroides pacaensis]|uniref:LexA family transcriptional regulator n=1 Tax=Parabacteroides pacaensis TaxID=2086575 RepID=UPI000D0EBE07|nr:S24 family peptidase [Parabacteroides pacaensis]